MYHDPSKHFAIGLLAVGIVTAMGLPTARALEHEPESDAAASTPYQRQAQESQQAVHELDLTSRQARRLLPIVEEAAGLQVEAYLRTAELLPDVVEAVTALAREASVGQGLTEAVEGPAQRLNNDLKRVRQQLDEDLIALEERAAEILSHRQQQAIGSESADRQKRAGARLTKPRASLRADQDDPLIAAQKEIQAINEQQHPSVGPLGRKLLHPTAGAALAEVAGVRLPEAIASAATLLERGTPAHPRAQVDAGTEELERLTNEMRNWNLINGLHLTAEQIGQIVNIFEQTDPQITAARPKDRLQLRATRERALEQVLNPGQTQVVQDYRPCLIPTPNLKDPVRVGQANDNSAYERWLGRARSASAKRLDVLVGLALDGEVKHFGPLTPSDRRQRENVLRRAAREAAAMPDVDFELNKAKLAEAIAPRDRVKELRSEMNEMTRTRGLPGAVEHFLMTPAFVAQLRERGQQLAGGPELKRTDLSKGPQAENCEKGCALPGAKK